MKTALLICSALPWLVAFASADDGPRFKSIIDCIEKTGKLWGVCAVKTNAEGQATLVDAEHSGYGFGLAMYDSTGKPVSEVTLSSTQFCTLSDGRHAFLKYELKSAKDGEIRIAVTERFDARSFGDRVTEKQKTVSIKPYNDEVTEPQRR